jgi:hypothetical protein
MPQSLLPMISTGGVSSATQLSAHGQPLGRLIST